MARTVDLMTLEPAGALRRLFGDFDRMFWPREWPNVARRTHLGEFPWLPELEMKEANGNLTLRVDLPGVKKEEVTITVGEGVLTIEGERKRETEATKDEWFTTERTYGRFVRTIPLPEGIRPEDVKATFANGVLELTARLQAAAAPPAARRIAIEEGGAAAEKATEKAAKVVA